MTPDRLDFLIVGVAKAATTWLRQQLQDDPEIHMPSPELHFFSRQYERGMDWYMDQFTPGPKTRLIGEKSNSYMDTPVAAARMHAALPHAKLVAVLRDPVDRAYSDYCMFYRRGTVSAEIEAYLDPARAAQLRFLSISRYDAHLKRLWDFYPADALHIAHYEDIAANPQGTLDGVRSHLGLAPRLIPAAAEERVNAAAAELLPLGLRRTLKPLKGLFQPLRGTPPFEAIRSRMAAPIHYPELTPTLRDRMRDHLAPVYDGLSDMGIHLPDAAVPAQ